VFRYLEKIMKFINRNAYIIVAVKGYNYCHSALRALKLIVNNALRLAAVNVIGDALIFLGKMTVVAACGCIAFLMSSITRFSDPTSPTYLSSPAVPVILACLSSYVVSSIFFAVRCHDLFRPAPCDSFIFLGKMTVLVACGCIAFLMSSTRMITGARVSPWLASRMDQEAPAALGLFITSVLKRDHSSNGYSHGSNLQRGM
jgi:hypothetical protein